jgi:hypothetical protein
MPFVHPMPDELLERCVLEFITIVKHPTRATRQSACSSATSWWYEVHTHITVVIIIVQAECIVGGGSTSTTRAHKPPFIFEVPVRHGAIGTGDGLEYRDGGGERLMVVVVESEDLPNPINSVKRDSRRADSTRRVDPIWKKT